MATKADQDAMRLYQDLMEELTARAHSVNVITQLSTRVPPPLLREYGYLQLRMMCEIIALGCLVAHGDIKATSSKRIQKAYDPVEIIRTLESLHPDFFPVPVNPKQTSEGWHLQDYDQPYLTKSELIKLYGLCGGVLHKGSLRKIALQKPARILNFDDLDQWGQKLLNLMSNHRITRTGGEFHFIAMLALNGKVTVAIAEGPGSPD